MKYIVATTILLVLFMVGNIKAQEKPLMDVPDSYVPHTPTGCVYGDMIPIEECDRYAPYVELTPQIKDVIVEDTTEGK